MGLADILPLIIGGGAAIPITGYEIKFAEDFSGVDFEAARPTAGAEFVDFMKYFAPIEAGGKLLPLYLLQDWIDNPMGEKFLHGLMIGNVVLDVLFFAKPDLYRSLVGMKFELPF